MKHLFLILVVISLTGFGQTADDYYNKGISKFNIKDYKGAISEFNKTIILNPNYADAYINRGIAKKKTLDYTAAITDYNKAIQLNPNNTDYFYNRGIAKYNLEDYNGSISDFNKAIELDSDNSDAYTMKEDATKKLKGNSSQTPTNSGRTNREKLSFSSTSGTLSKAVGWSYNSTLGEWIDYENVISDSKDYKDKYKSLSGEYMMSHISQNFQKVQTRTVTYKGTIYYVLIIDKWSGRYEYPSIQQDWYEFKETIGYIYTKDEYQKLLNIETLVELKTRYEVSIGSKYEKYDEIKFLDLIQTELSQEKSSSEFTFPVKKSKEGAIRFYLPENFSYFEKYNFEKKYFESDYNNFDKIILK